MRKILRFPFLFILLCLSLTKLDAQVTIYDIQYTTNPTGDSPLATTIVTTTGTVTAVATGAYWIQDAPGAWNGVYVYDAAHSPAIGDNITVTATVSEYNGLTELATVTSYVVNSSGNTIDPVVVSTLDVGTESYEGVLVQVVNASCTNPSAGFGMWEVNDGTGPLLIDDVIFAYVPQAGVMYDVTGVCTFTFAEWKIYPRSSSDVILSGSGSADLDGDSFRIAAYNMLDFPNTTEDRWSSLKTIIQTMQPDILIANEMNTEYGAQLLLDNAFNADGITYYNRAVFDDGPDTDNMLYYNGNKFILMEQNIITTALRYIMHYKLYVNSIDIATDPDTIFLNVFSCHLKASQGFETNRRDEIMELFNFINANGPFENVIVGGDFNFYGSSVEPAYDSVVGNAIRPLIDVAGAGDWHSNPGFAGIHTQCTRLDPGFGGGASGGMDDRFDFLFFGPELISGENKAAYIADSYKAFGNDGTGASYQNAINSVASAQYSQAVLDALFNFSDHLPVMADIVVGDTINALSTACDILTFTVPGQIGNSVISTQGSSVNITVPQGTNLSSLVPTITVSAGASVNPASGVAQNFTNTVIYTVTAEDGVTSKNWNVTVAYPPTIYDIQYTTNPVGDSPYNGQEVTVSGVVCATRTGAYWIQDGAGPWNGIYVYDNLHFPVIGDSITITCTVSEYFNLTELITVTAYTTHSSGNQIYIDNVSTIDVQNESYESVMVSFSGSECVGLPNVYNEWLINNSIPADSLIVDDVMYAYVPVLGNMYTVRGVMYYAYSTWRLLPRDAGDVIPEGLSSEAEIISFSFAEQTGPAVINSAGATVDIEVANGSNLASLIPTITISAAANINPVSGVAQDFSAPFVYTVTAEDATIKNWTVNVTEYIPPVLVSIYDIQYTTDPAGNSPYLGMDVITSGVVTAAYANGYWIQDGTDVWSGVFVYDNMNLPSRGDEIEVTATVAEYNNLTELATITNYVLLSSGNSVVPTQVSTADLNTEPYEGVLVKAMMAECTNDVLSFGEWHVNDGTGDLVVDDLMLPYQPTAGLFYNITGIDHYGYGTFRIEPRDSLDIELFLGNNEMGNSSDINIYPVPATNWVTFSSDSKLDRFEIFNQLGQKVMEGEINNSSKIICITQLPNGIYIVNLSSAKNVETFKLVKN